MLRPVLHVAPSADARKLVFLDLTGDYHPVENPGGWRVPLGLGTNLTREDVELVRLCVSWPSGIATDHWLQWRPQWGPLALEAAHLAPQRVSMQTNPATYHPHATDTSGSVTVFPDGPYRLTLEFHSRKGAHSQIATYRVELPVPPTARFWVRRAGGWIDVTTELVPLQPVPLYRFEAADSVVPYDAYELIDDDGRVLARGHVEIHDPRPTGPDDVLIPVCVAAYTHDFLLDYHTQSRLLGATLWAVSGGSYAEGTDRHDSLVLAHAALTALRHHPRQPGAWRVLKYIHSLAEEVARVC